LHVRECSQVPTPLAQSLDDPNQAKTWMKEAAGVTRSWCFSHLCG
jgi:uncharacterized phage protein gp47/JayE